MTVENLANNIEVKANKINSLKEELKKLRDEVKEKYIKDIKEGKKITDNLNRHLLRFTDEDIKNIPDEHLEFWDELNQLEVVHIDENCNELCKKINSLFAENGSSCMRSILAHKLVQLTLAGGKKIAA